MKPLLQLPILAAAMLSLVGTTHTQAQTTPLPPSAPPAPPALFPPETLQEMSTYRHLGPGSMASAVESLEEQYFEKYTKDGEERDLFPKLIYGPGAKEAKIASDLKLCLYNMRAVDAVALVAAAAGCRLEPIPALPEAPDDKKKPQRVVGYYVTIAMSPITVQAPDAKPMLWAMRPNSLNNITTLSPPPLVNVEPAVDTFFYTNTAITPGSSTAGTVVDTPVPSAPVRDAATIIPTLPGMPAASLQPHLPSEQVMRIYPVAFFYTGNETPEQLVEKNTGLKTLIEELVKDIGPHDRKELVLNMHHATKILIVKATQAQHEIIQQVMTSLKENQQTEAQRAGALPR